MAGIGKTQLALEYIYRHAEQYDLAWWVNAEDALSIGDQFASLADELDISGSADFEAMIRKAHRALRGRSRWIIVFDNAAVPEDLRGSFPSAGSGHVLITARRADGFRDLGTVLEVDTFTRADSVALLRHRVRDLACPDASALAERLGDLPLALAQASAYIDNSRLSSNEYIGLLETNSAEIYAKGSVHAYPGSVATIWAVSLQRLKETSPAAIQLLSLCAWMAPEPIPRDLFLKNAALLPMPLAATAGDSCRSTISWRL